MATDETDKRQKGNGEPPGDDFEWAAGAASLTAEPGPEDAEAQAILSELASSVRRGEVRLAGVPAPARSPRERLHQGLGLVSEDRKDEGLALGLSVAENTTLSRLAPFVRFGWLRRREQATWTSRWVERLGIRCRDPWQPVEELSGGNQQKVALARLLHHDVDVLLLDEPTRGIDVGAKVEVYRLMGELAAQGKAVIVISSELPELLGICDRILVMREYRITGEIVDLEQATQEQIMALAI